MTVFRGVNFVRLDDKDRKGQRPVCGAHTPPPNNSVTKVGNFCERMLQMWSKAPFSWHQGGMIILKGSSLIRWSFERDWAFCGEKDFNSSWIYSCFAGFSLSSCLWATASTLPMGVQLASHLAFLMALPTRFGASCLLDGFLYKIWDSHSQPAQLHKPCNIPIRIDISYWFMLLWLNPGWYNHFPEGKPGDVMSHFPFSIPSTVKNQEAEREHQNAVGSFYSKEFCSRQWQWTLN